MLIRVVLTSLLAVFAGGTIAVAHEEGVLESSQSAVAAGGKLTVDGSHFGKGESYVLKLVGALNEYELRKVEADTASKFSIELEIPANVRPGQYKLTAIASDGDKAASLDLIILERALGTAEEVEHQPSGESVHEEAMDFAAQAADLPIQRSRSGAEWGIIGLLIGLAGGLGVTVIRRA